MILELILGLIVFFVTSCAFLFGFDKEGVSYGFICAIIWFVISGASSLLVVGMVQEMDYSAKEDIVLRKIAHNEELTAEERYILLRQEKSRADDYKYHIQSHHQPRMFINNRGEVMHGIGL